MKKLLATFGLLFLAISADAATLHYSYPGSPYVTAIESLDVGGTLYNVDFDADAYSTFGGDVEFWTTEAEASAAVDGINALFVANNVYDVSNDGIDDCLGHGCYTVNFGPGSGVLGYEFGDWLNACCVGGSEFDPIRTAWSVAVPIPAAVWLFGSALAGLGWMHRRKTV
jgi:hypothetical protein